jgi:FkbM family methyltransferase
MTFYSQDRQDFNLENYVFRGFKNGIFVDVGAHDGKKYNNTLYFEETHNWKGINIEPIPEVFDELVKNRPTSINLNCAIDTHNSSALFCINKGHTEMLSGLEKYYHPSHIQRIMQENTEHNSYSDKIIVKTRSLDSIFDEYNIKHIHYLSIDVEGAEFAVIKSIDFDKVFIDVIGFEANYSDTTIEIIDYLKNKNYFVFYKGLDIFMIHTDSKFANF